MMNKVTMNKVTKVGHIEDNKLLIKLDTPVTYSEYVKVEAGAYAPYQKIDYTTDYAVVSISKLLFDEPETLIFPADEAGNIVSWIEVGGAAGVADFDAAISSAGWTYA